MKLIDPKVELFSELDITPESHIARCARVCYGREYKEPNKDIDKKMVDGLIKRKHLSMLRHGSIYIFNRLKDFAQYINASSYWSNNRYYGYASTNLQEFINVKYIFGNHEDDGLIEIFSNKSFLEKCAKLPELFGLYRLTFCITTQISTSRELNRVSPNAIAEKSTRYCSYKNGIEICKPWWWDNNDMQTNKIRYESAINKAELCYQGMVNDGMKPEDTRGVLPLDTATKVIYTYSVNEWRHIIDLRYYGTTGVPQPNAKIVIGIVRDKINNFANKHGIKYSV